MPKILWVALPLLLYGLYVAHRVVRGRVPLRRALGVHTSLLLLLYAAATAGLGVFWVAHQQLPPFDLHYLLGYATLVLLAVHLSLNLRSVLRFFVPKSRARPQAEEGAVRRAPLGLWLGVGAALAAAFLLGMRHGRNEVRVAWPAGQASAGAAARGPVELVERYHELSSLSRRGVFARAPSVDWGPAPPRFKAYPGAERVALPPVERAAAQGRSLSEVVLGPVSGAAAGLGLEALAQILFHSAGITGERPEKRAAPSSGGLFPNEVYVVARAVAGLPPGVYHYAPDQHALDRIGTGVPEAARLGVDGSPLLERAPAVLLLSAIFRRTGHKYQDRAFRYVTADTGHAIENARLAAAELGLRAVALDRFDEGLAAAALGIDGREEGVLAVVVLAPADATPWPQGGVEAAPRFAYLDAPAAAAEPIGATGMALAATSLRLLGPGRGARASAAAPSPSGSATPGLLGLPPAEPAPRSALATIGARRSERRYGGEAVDAGQVASILRDATAPGPVLSRALGVYLVAARVRGLPPGVYRYRPQAHALGVVHQGDMAGQARAAALGQDVVGDAAALFVLTIDRGLALGSDGARGYRHAYLEVGMVGERLQLGAVARGLGACPVGAFFDDQAAELVQIDPNRQWVAHFVTLGRVAE
ncbi:MAG: SagB family peptide dehydrogenase [Deltaproteobacteria bacterium]|nr:SagB family peptide dehydrogenase [Deltaproteobacteria bacterium]